MGSSSATLRPILSGTASVHCVHDRQVAQVTTERQVAELGLEAGVLYDPAQHRVHRCACCRNLFVDPSDEPRYCHVCTRPFVHAPAAPIAAPIGEVDE